MNRQEKNILKASLQGNEYFIIERNMIPYNTNLNTS